LVTLFALLQRKELTGDWRQVLYFYCIPNIIRAIKWRRMRQIGHVACMGEERQAYEVFERVTIMK
jgi:hypothetical protein